MLYVLCLSAIIPWRCRCRPPGDCTVGGTACTEKRDRLQDCSKTLGEEVVQEGKVRALPSRKQRPRSGQQSLRGCRTERREKVQDCSKTLSGKGVQEGKVRVLPDRKQWFRSGHQSPGTAYNERKPSITLIRDFELARARLDNHAWYS